MADAQKLLPTDTLRQGYPKINDAIDNANESLNKHAATDLKADEAIATANAAETKADSVQEQFNQVVIDGDSSVEAAQARVDSNNNTFATLKERLDTKEDSFTAQLADIVYNVRNFGAVGDGVTDDTNAIQSAIDALIALGGGTVYFPPGKVYKISYTLEYGSNITFSGYGAKLFLELSDSTAVIFISKGFETGELKTDVSFLGLEIETSQGLGNGICISYTNSAFVKDIKTNYTSRHMIDIVNSKYVTISDCEGTCLQAVYQLDTSGTLGAFVVKKKDGSVIQSPIIAGTTDNITINNVRGSSTDSALNGGCIHFHRGGGKNIKIKDSFISNSIRGINSDSGTSWNNITIENVVFENVPNCIYFQGNIKRILINDIKFNAIEGNRLLWFGTTSNVEEVIVSNSYFDKVCSEHIRFEGPVTNIIIQGNKFLGQKKSSQKSIVFSFSSTSRTEQYSDVFINGNKFQDVSQAILVAKQKDVTVSDNTFDNCGDNYSSDPIESGKREYIYFCIQCRYAKNVTISKNKVINCRHTFFNYYKDVDYPNEQIFIEDNKSINSGAFVSRSESIGSNTLVGILLVLKNNQIITNDSSYYTIDIHGWNEVTVNNNQIKNKSGFVGNYGIVIQNVIGFISMDNIVEGLLSSFGIIYNGTTYGFSRRNRVRNSGTDNEFNLANSLNIDFEEYYLVNFVSPNTGKIKFSKNNDTPPTSTTLPVGTIAEINDKSAGGNMGYVYTSAGWKGFGSVNS